MNPFFLGPRERLSAWKALRDGLKGLPEDEQLTSVARYWSQAPLERFAYDPENAKSWPTMWEMIAENHWCPLSIAIGMEQSLRLGGWPEDRLKLLYIKDHDISDLRLVVQIDDDKWLNYDHGIVVSIPDTRRDLVCGWQFQGRSYKEVR